MTASIDTAISRVQHQSQHGPRFRPGYCQEKTHDAFDVPSDGTKDATTDWYHSKHQHRVYPGDHAGIMAIPRGALLAWTGGSEGHGHRAIAAGNGKCWSVDILRSGYWDEVPIEYIGKTWKALHFEGWTEDTDGVVVYHPAPAPVPSHPLVRAVLHAKPGAERIKAMHVLANKGAQPYAQLAEKWLEADSTRRAVITSLTEAVR